MKVQQFREQTPDELEQTLRDVGDELFNLRVKKSTGDSSAPPSRFGVLRRDIARIETVKSERKAEQNG